MVRQLDDSPKTAIVYPDSDGKPMTDNTRQFRWITTIKANLDWLFANNADVFVAGDLLEMTRKLLFYDRYGVEEYYIYNPDKNDLGGCIRRENRLEYCFHDGGLY